MKIAYVVNDDITRSSGVINKIQQQIKVWKSFGHVVKVFSLSSKCGVDTSFFDCNLIQIPKKNKIIIFPADPNRKVKNFDLFQRTINILQQSISDEIQIITFQNMNRFEIKNALCTSDCLIMTSISEGSPQIIKEAMSCKLPIVSVDVGDVKELLKNVKGSYVAQSYDPQILADLVRQALDIPKNSSGREELLKYDLDNRLIADKLLAAYKKVFTQCI